MRSEGDAEQPSRPWWRKLRGTPADTAPPPKPLSAAGIWVARGAVAATVILVAVLVVATASLLPVFLLVVPLIGVARIPNVQRRQIFGSRPARGCRR